MKRTDSLKIWIIAEVVLLVLVAVLTVLKISTAGDETKEATYILPTETNDEVSIDEIEIPVNLYEGEDQEMAAASGMDKDPYLLDDYPAETLEKLAGMDTVQKISGLFVISPETLCGVGRVTRAGDVFRRAYANTSVSGIILSDRNFESEASGMQMLKTIRDLSREFTGMNIMLGYREQADNEAAPVSDRGFNMFMLTQDEDTEAKASQAQGANMVPAIIFEPDSDMSSTPGIVKILKAGSASQVIESVNAGNSVLYSIDSKEIIEDLKNAVETGEIPGEALDHAAGYAVTVRLALTQVRPEEYEKIPETTAQTTPDNNPAQKTPEKTKTPEELAAEAAAAQAAALQKQLEEAQKEAQKQLEDAQKAAAAAAQTAPQ